MTPEREAEIRVRHNSAAHLPDSPPCAACDLLAALDAARAREGRLREAARAFALVVHGGKPQSKVSLNLDAALASPDATSWLAGRERAAAVRALRWVQRWVYYNCDDEDTLRWIKARADAIEAGTEEPPR